MGIVIKGGMTIRGIQVRGAEFLAPTDIATCKNWYKWKEGLTIDGSNNVQTWADSGGSDNVSIGQGTTTRRPAYNAITGRITFDGSNDYLQSGTLPFFSSGTGAEFTCVVEIPTVQCRIMDRVRNTSADTDGIRMAITPSTGIINKSVAVSGGQSLASPPGVLPPIGTKCVISFGMQMEFYINGAATSTVGTKIGSMADISTPRWVFGAAATNTGGLPDVPTTYYPISFYEICFHNHRLSTLERTKLVNYFKVKHGIE